MIDVTFQRTALDAAMNIVVVDVTDVNIPLEHGAQTGPRAGKRASRVAEAPPAARALGARRRDRTLGLENTLASELTPRMQSVTSEPALFSTFIRVVALRAAKGCTRSSGLRKGRTGSHGSGTESQDAPGAPDLTWGQVGHSARCEGPCFGKAPDWRVFRAFRFRRVGARLQSKSSRATQPSYGAHSSLKGPSANEGWPEGRFRKRANSARQSLAAVAVLTRSQRVSRRCHL